MGLRIIPHRGGTEDFDLHMVEWETLLAKEGKRWADWRLTSSEELKEELRKKIRKAHLAQTNSAESRNQLLRVETTIKQLQNISTVHGQKSLDSETVVDLL